MLRPKWFRSERDLVAGDLVYFMKRDIDLTGKWTIWMVDLVSKGADGVIREVMIKYCTLPRYTERSVGKLVRIFSFEDVNLGEDLAELSKRVSTVVTGFCAGCETSSNSGCQDCCCEGHCGISMHTDSFDITGVPLAIDPKDVIEESLFLKTW